MSILDWFSLGWTGLISLQSKELWRIFSNTIVQKFKSISSLELSFLYDPALTSIHDYWKNHSFERWTFVGKIMHPWGRGKGNGDGAQLLKAKDTADHADAMKPPYKPQGWAICFGDHVVTWKSGTPGEGWICLQCRRPEFSPCVGESPWRREQLSHSRILTENSTDRRAWWATVHRVKKSRTWLCD